jgi:hypothetical protein
MESQNLDDQSHGIGEFAADKFQLDVSDETFQFITLSFGRDDEVTASQIAEKFGAHPVSQFKILQQLDTGEIETKRPNETTNLRGDGRERFFVIRADRTFGFTVDGLAMEWPLPIPGAHLRALVHAKDDEEVVRVTPEGFMPVDDDDIVSFEDPETEEFRVVSRKRTVTVRYREQSFELERREWSTEELIEKFGVPAGYKLDLIKPDGEFKELKPGKKLKVREGMEFTSHVPTGQSS